MEVFKTNFHVFHFTQNLGSCISLFVYLFFTYSHRFDPVEFDHFVISWVFLSAKSCRVCLWNSWIFTVAYVHLRSWFLWSTSELIFNNWFIISSNQLPLKLLQTRTWSTSGALKVTWNYLTLTSCIKCLKPYEVIMSERLTLYEVIMSSKHFRWCEFSFSWFQVGLNSWSGSGSNSSRIGEVLDNETLWGVCWETKEA